MTRNEWLKLVTEDGYRLGYISDETHDAGRGIRVSDEAVKRAKHVGLDKREALRKQFGVWEAWEANHKIREELKRALSCGDLLDEPENVERLKNLRITKALAVAADNAFLAAIEVTP